MVGFMRKRSIVKLVVAALVLTSCDCAGRAAQAERKVTTMKLRVITKDAVLTATLDDNAATRDFVAMLPLRVTLRDYAGTEKVADLPKKLSTRGTPAGVDPEVGDLAYYAPWGNLAIFYRDFEYSKGLVRLGHIQSGIEKLASARGDLVVRFELDETR